MLASLVFDAVLAAKADRRKKPVVILCTDTRVEIPAIVEMVESTLSRMHKFSQQHGLNIEVNLLRPPPAVIYGRRDEIGIARALQ